MNSTNKHGGNIYQKAKELNIPEEKILDFSANINPLGMPEFIRDALRNSIEGNINYPDPDCAELSETIAKYHQVRPSRVLCGNGGADLLFRIAYGLRPKKTVLPVPAFVEYEEALRAAGNVPEYYYMDSDFLVREDLCEEITEDTDLLILCNPNNPTGLLTGRELIIKLLERAEKTGTVILLDECFLDICEEWEEYTLIPLLDRYPNLMILKSFTKLFAIPGVRLGYLLCSDEETLAKVRGAGQAWSVSWPAQCAGIAALSRPGYRDRVIREVGEQRRYMVSRLKKMPVTLYEGTANYLFFRAPGMTDLDRRLEKYGLMIRNCSNYVNLGDDYWRIAVRNHEENKILLQAMEEIFQIEKEGV